MRQMMLDRDDLDLLEVEAKLHETPLDPLFVTIKTSIAGEDGVERTVRRVEVAPGVVPACLPGQADRRIGNGDGINIGGFQSGEIQTEFRRLVGHAALGVLVAHEAFFFGSSDQLAANVKCGRRVMRQRAGESENCQSQGVFRFLKYCREGVNNDIHGEFTLLRVLFRICVLATVFQAAFFAGRSGLWGWPDRRSIPAFP